MSLPDLSNKALLEALYLAEEISLDPDFISQLKREIMRRQIHPKKVNQIL